jgi:outer membrane protein OmpA-like peptidoglycan-associated protein
VSAVRAAAVGLLVLLAVPGGRAGAEELPNVDLKGAQFPSGGLSFPAGPLNLPSGSVNLPSGGLNLPSYGLAQPTGTARELRFDLMSDVLFDFDKAELRPEADGVLRQLLAEVATRMKAPRYRVEGHTDAKGSDAYNLDLSRRRAESVKLWLTRNGGVPAASVGTEGFGRSRPVAPNAKPDGSDDPEGRQKNRRVEIVATRRS